MSETAFNSKPAPSAEKPPSIVDRMRGDVDGQGAQMTFMDHLLELRQRLWVSSLVIVSCMVLAMLFYKPLVASIRWPVDNLNVRYYEQKTRNMLENFMPPEAAAIAAACYAEQYAKELEENPDAVPVKIKLISTDPMETVLMVMWLSIGAGLVFSSPVLIYQLWAFVAPGLREKEKRAIKPVLYGGIFFFLAGCALAYYVLFPVSIRLFSLVNMELAISSQWTMDKYSSLLLNMMAICGLVCETPLVVAGLAKLGILRPAHLTQYWRFCIFGSVVLGATFSPGTDIMSMLLFSGLLLSLYIVSIIMAHVFYPRGAATVKPEPRP